MSVNSETISQHTMGGDNEGLYVDNKEPIQFEWKPNQLSKAREIYFKYFPLQRMARTKATVCRKAMMGIPLMQSVSTERGSEKSRKGKTPKIGIKWLDKTRSKIMKKTGHKNRFQPSHLALWEIWKFQKSTELLAKAPFLWLVREILQKEHGDHHIQAGVVLVLHEATKSCLIHLL